MTRTRCGMLVVGEMILLLGPLLAQQPPSLAAGRRVRVTAPAAGIAREVGTLEAVTPDSVVWVRVVEQRLFYLVQLDTLRRAVPRAALQSLEVSVAKKGHALIGLGIGMAAGAALGGLGYAASSSRYGAGIFIPLLSAVGGAIGAAIGAAHTDVWRAVPLDRLHTGATPPPFNRLGFGVSLAI